MKRLVGLAMLLAACSRGPQVPLDTQLWRLHQAWQSPAANPSLRVANATIISFRKTGEYIEHTCRLIEHPDESVYISSRDPHRIAIGTWKIEGSEIVVTRQITSHASCGTLRFRVNGNSVVSSEGRFSPVTRLVSPDFEMYINDARKSGTPCAVPGK